MSGTRQREKPDEVSPMTPLTRAGVEQAQREAQQRTAFQQQPQTSEKQGLLDRIKSWASQFDILGGQRDQAEEQVKRGRRQIRQFGQQQE